MGGPARTEADFLAVLRHGVERLHIESLHQLRLAAYLRLATGWAEVFGITLKALNVGGGLGVNYTDPAVQFPLGRFVQGLARLLKAKMPGFPLQFECGRYLAAFCGHYLAEVVDIKSNHGKTFAVLRGGTHHFRLPASWGHSHSFRVLAVEDWPYPFPRPSLEEGPITLAGELCSPKDILARDVPVTRLRAGDVVAFQFTGAYGWHISHHDFLSHPHAELVYLSGSRPVSGNQSKPTRPVELIEVARLRPTEECISQRVDWLVDVLSHERVWRWPIRLEQDTLAVMDGHHRLEAARRLGLKRVPCLRYGYQEVVVEARTDLPVTPAHILARVFRGELYPPKSTRHLFPDPGAGCLVPLDILRGLSAAGTEREFY